MRARLLTFFMLAFLLCTMNAHATIAGPTNSSSGNFTLQWDFTYLKEVTSAGVLIATYTGQNQSFSKQTGTYYFQEIYCLHVTFAGWICFPAGSNHWVIVAADSGSGASYPESIREQSNYDYRIRSGDFDSNGRTDLYVERLTAGPTDGSMQSYVVWNNSNGTISTAALTIAHSSAALSAPINKVVNLMQTDVNADGFADHMIERIDQVMGSGFEQELAVFAPGTAANKTTPQGNTQVDANFMSFFIDIARWMNNEKYFANNIHTTQIPIYAFGYFCTTNVWYDTTFSFFSGGLCFPYVYVVGYQTVQYGVNFSALSATIHMNNATKNMNNEANSVGELSENALWEISQIARNVIGVHLFGFDTNGNRHTTNHGGDDDAKNRFKAFYSFALFSIATARNTSLSFSEHEHDYTVETTTCTCIGFGFGSLWPHFPKA